MPAIPPTANQAKSDPKRIRRTYFNLAPMYRHMISQTIPRIITVHRSGIKRKMKNSIALRTRNEMKNGLVFVMLRFLSNHDHKNNTYPSLKNSAGWILGKNGILIHHLAPLSVIPMPGINTDICSTMRMMAMIVMFLSF
jgi:hypothetical protein